MSLIGLIPAAGKGTRLHPLPFSKELYPIGYHEVQIDGESKLRPKVVSQYLVNHMTRMGVEKIIITLGPGKSDIMDYYGSGRTTGVPIVYNFQSVAKGMPYALDLSFPWIRPDDVIVFGMSDTIIEPVNAFVDLKTTFEKIKPDLMLGLFPTQNPKKFGMVDYNPQTHLVAATIDKPKETKLTHMWGCCFWNYTFCKFMHDFLKTCTVSEGKEVVFGDVINQAIKQGLRVCGQSVNEGRYIDIGTIEDLDQAIKQFHL